MATKTIQQFIAELEVKKKAIQENQPLAIAAADTHARMVERIFDDGTACDGAKIGDYNSTDPIYVNPNTSPRGFATKGKSGKTTFSDGRPHKTGYFESYKAFRQAIGRQTGFVDLQLFGNLRNDFSNSLKRADDNTWTSGVKLQQNGDKVRGMEAKYGAVFCLTDTEAESFHKVLHDELVRLLSN